jgi:hypothetical protein
MKLFLYAGKDNGNENRLAASIQSAVPGRKIERFVSMHDLLEGLRFNVEPESIVVLQPADHKELYELQPFRDLLAQSFVILVLPDREESTIKLAHLLQPRYISQFDEDFMDLNQIVCKMIQSSPWA